jgi:hypothetical protein
VQSVNKLAVLWLEIMTTAAEAASNKAWRKRKKFISGLDSFLEGWGWGLKVRTLNLTVTALWNHFVKSRIIVSLDHRLFLHSSVGWGQLWDNCITLAFEMKIGWAYIGTCIPKFSSQPTLK